MATTKTKGKALAGEPETLLAAASSTKKKAPVRPASEPETLFASGRKKKKPVKVKKMLLLSEPETLFAAVNGVICLEQGEVTKVKLKLTKDKKGNPVIKVVD
ncbi:MAG: hypothetical protein IT162_15400 [Bryobacterales bacterium]|nr:hypothetical protein [Bryobacterales bacterium]